MGQRTWYCWRRGVGPGYAIVEPLAGDDNCKGPWGMHCQRMARVGGLRWVIAVSVRFIKSLIGYTVA